MDLKLKDKVVLIIAATGDSGVATAKAFANEGCTLAVTSTSQAKLDALTYAEFDDAISEYKKELKDSELFKQLTDLENENSVASIYSTWHDDLYPPET